MIEPAPCAEGASRKPRRASAVRIYEAKERRAPVWWRPWLELGAQELRDLEPSCLPHAACQTPHDVAMTKLENILCRKRGAAHRNASRLLASGPAVPHRRQTRGAVRPRYKRQSAPSVGKVRRRRRSAGIRSTWAFGGVFMSMLGSILAVTGWGGFYPLRKRRDLVARLNFVKRIVVRRPIGFGPSNNHYVGGRRIDALGFLWKLEVLNNPITQIRPPALGSH